MGIKKDQTLIFACENNDLDLVKAMLNIGADIHKFNEMPLRIAAKKGHLEIVKYLLSKGAVIGSRDKKIFRDACDNYHYDIVHCLIEALNKLENIVDVDIVKREREITNGTSNSNNMRFIES